MAKKKPKPWAPKKPHAEMRARSERLELRPLVSADFEAWRAGLLGRKPKQHKFDDPRYPLKSTDRSRFRQHLKNQNVGARKLVSFSFGIFDRKSGAMVGSIGYFVINRRMRWANLGYSVHNQHWGQGIAPEAARLCLSLGFGPLDLHRIEAACELGNQASAKTARRAGLREEGIRRKFFAHKGGIDMLVFAQNQIDHRKRALKRDRKKKRG